MSLAVLVITLSFGLNKKCPPIPSSVSKFLFNAKTWRNSPGFLGGLFYSGGDDGESFPRFTRNGTIFK